MPQTDHNITGTLIWYYYICPREVWLMSHQLEADQSDENMTWGRYLHEHAYAREKKELSFGHAKFDLVKKDDDQLVVVEVKKTNRYKKSATMQLLFYLYNLKQQGIIATGELRFPEQKQIVKVELNEVSERELLQSIAEIERIIGLDVPPPAQKHKFCGKCAYQELCWA